MFKLLNSSPLAPTPGRCNIGDETSNNKTQIAIEGSNGKRQQVKNYHLVMTENFKVPRDKFFNAIPINVAHLRSFIANNGEGLDACRIYITKTTADSNLDDYELLFVPCITEKDANGNILAYRDNLGTEKASNVVSFTCRRPPDCKMGALLLNDK